MGFDHRKSRCAAARGLAYRTVAQSLIPVIGVDFRVSEWTETAGAAYRQQWCGARHPDAGWDWPEIFAQYRAFDRLPIVVWTLDDRLCALGLGTLSRKALTVRFFEGDPRSDCPLKGRRILIAFEVAARYAQSMGRVELRAEPVNSSLEHLYRDTYGFTTMVPTKGLAYIRKEI